MPFLSPYVLQWPAVKDCFLNDLCSGAGFVQYSADCSLGARAQGQLQYIDFAEHVFHLTTKKKKKEGKEKLLEVLK